MQIIQVKDQELHVVSSEKLAGDQVEFARFRFMFSESWDGLDKTAQFQQNCNTYNMHLGSDSTASCMMPSEVEAGELFVSVFGIDVGGNVVATTIPVRMIVGYSGYAEGKESVVPTPDLYQQLLEEIEKSTPHVTVERVEDGVEVVATDVTGTTTATVYDGSGAEMDAITHDEIDEIYS